MPGERCERSAAREVRLRGVVERSCVATVSGAVSPRGKIHVELLHDLKSIDSVGDPLKEQLSIAVLDLHILDLPHNHPRCFEIIFRLSTEISSVDKSRSVSS